MSTCIYPGSFDPLTIGHLDIIRRASTLFDEVVVAVLHNSQKRCTYTPQQRVEFIEACVGDMPGVRAIHFEGLLVEAARQQGAEVILRGLRMEADYASEAQTAEINHRISGGLETLFLPTRPAFTCVSSSIVRELLYYGVSVAGLVPGAILDRVVAAYQRPAR